MYKNNFGGESHIDSPNRVSLFLATTLTRDKFEADGMVKVVHEERDRSPVGRTRKTKFLGRLHRPPRLSRLENFDITLNLT